MSTPVYQLTGVTKTYCARQVLSVEHLDVFKGEILTIVGPSGAGKSTLLRLLAFLEVPTAGAVHFMGMEFSIERDLPLHMRRRVTMVFQSPILLKRSVRANVAYALRLRGRRHTSSAVDAVLDEIGLLSVAEEQAHTLSGGEAQRVALARAMILQPDVLLLDEPTANLDPYNVTLIETIMRRINEMGTTLVLVTHNVFQARRMAHRVALLLDRQIVEVGTPEAFFGSPSDHRTAAFVCGDMVY